VAGEHGQKEGDNGKRGGLSKKVKEAEACKVRERVQACWEARGAVDVGLRSTATSRPWSGDMRVQREGDKEGSRVFAKK
jgi:hypothetical protein